MAEVIKIKRGVDIKLVGEAQKEFAKPKQIKTAAIKPVDFHGVRFKLSVKEGDEVKAGTPLLYNKDDEQIRFCSTISGEVAQVVRGAKRRILEVRVLADKETEYEDFGALDPLSAERDEIIEKLTASGCWPFLKQRPYNIIAGTSSTPKAIYISGFDSAPLAPDIDLLIEGQKKEFQTGIDALSKLTTGKVHLGLRAGKSAGDVFSGLERVATTRFEGPHPAGLVGVQIHHTDPINKGETVWTITPEHVVIIGRLFLNGIFDARINVAVTGSEAKTCKYYPTVVGAAVSHILDGNTSDKKNRIITGNVLTGTKIEEDGYLSFFERQITVIPEGEDPELFGWLIPKTDKFSISRTLPAWMMPNKKYELNTNMHGERRAFVVTGQYEKVFPFDIYPVQLLKSIIVNDIDTMESLGIYEVAEEDFALCEVVCTSKIPVQDILRKGLDLMRQELG